MTLADEIMPNARFLTAEWRHLAMLNYEIDPDVLLPLVPAGTELDLWHGRALVSIDAFMFTEARLLGVMVPWHRSFEEVNLRFYVRRAAPEGWRRAVVFVKEIAPRRAIAWVAHTIYGENYAVMPMGHRLPDEDEGAGIGHSVAYWWMCHGRKNQLDITTHGAAHLPQPDTEAEFVTEHYWAYTGGGQRRTFEYRVEHPRWQVTMARQARLDCDVANIYGPRFVEPLAEPPSSAFLVDGSAVTVFTRTEIAVAEVCYGTA